MRKIFLLLMLLPLIALSQKANVVSASRYFPKADKVMEFEKALTAHIQKYHNGTWKWRVYEIQTGPDAGGYHVVEGPKSWDEFDKRGNLGADHMTDWNKNVAVYLTDKYSSSYSEYKEELSTVQLGDFSDKIVITHVFPKVGWASKVEESIKMAKKAWATGNQTVAVYGSVASGPFQYALVYRLKDGLKELQDDYRKPMKERYEGVNGEGSYEYQMDRIREYTDNAWTEMLFFRSDLSAK